MLTSIRTIRIGTGGGRLAWSDMRCRPIVVAGTWLLAFVLGPNIWASAAEQKGHQTSLGNVLCNPQRTGYAANELQPPLRAAWIYADRHAPRPAWKEPIWEPQRIDFDYAYAISADNQYAYLASSSDHGLHAIDLQSGQSVWKFFASGPIRLAATVHNDHVLFGSDDGFVYCLQSETGELLWRYRPDIPDRRLLGNEQMISRWPVRSGVLIEGNLAYVAFGMLSPEGISVCCLDANTGKLLWTNDATGTRYMARPHTPGMGGVSPQGYLALCGDVLVVPCGRAPPALFNKQTGSLLYHEAEGDFTGGAWTMAAHDLVLTPCETLVKEYGSELRRNSSAAEAPPFPSASLVALSPTTGHEVFTLQGARRAVMSDSGTLTLLGPGHISAVQLSDVVNAISKESTIRHTTGHFVDPTPFQLWSVETDIVYTLLQAGTTIYAGGRDQVLGFDAATGNQIWQAKVTGQARNLALAAGRLLVSTTAGRLYSFHAITDDAQPPTRKIASRQVRQHSGSPVVRQVAAILRQSEVSDGYCLVLGDSTTDFLSELALRSKLSIYAVAASKQIDLLRDDLDLKGLQGVRVTVHECSTDPLPYSSYFANLIVVKVDSPSKLQQLSAAEIDRVLRPYGGICVMICDPANRAMVRTWLTDAGIAEEECQDVSCGVLYRRGELEGAGEWTHQYADAGKSCASTEMRARLPLEALWFGGLGPAPIVSRHFRTPAPLVIDGRCFVPGTDNLIAMDIYNGQQLWQLDMPDLAHWPAAYRGPAMAVDHDALYVLQNRTCLTIDPSNGSTIGTIDPPLQELANPATDATIWEFLAVTPKLVIGTLGQANIKREWWSKAYPENHLLFACDKQTGKTIWTYRPAQPIDSNAIAIGADRLFIKEGRLRDDLRRRGVAEDKVTSPHVLKALNLTNGEVIWETTEILPRQNSLWTRDNVLVATIHPYSRSMEDPQVAQAGGGVAAYSTADGKRLWRIKEVTTCSPVLLPNVLHLPQAYDLQTGKPLQVDNPISSTPEAFNPSFPRACSNFCGSPNLLMSRSGSLGFFDLASQSGYYHYPIVRASCWINMIPAGGLVVVPEGSSSCMCGYNYKTSMALIAADRQHHFGIRKPQFRGRVAELHVNFGAPGDHMDTEGQTWFAYPRPVAVGRPLAKAKYGPKIGGGLLPITTLAPETLDPVVRFTDWTDTPETDARWMFSCGIPAPIELEFHLADAATEPSRYRMTVHVWDETGGNPRKGLTLLVDGKGLPGVRWPLASENSIGRGFSYNCEFEAQQTVKVAIKRSTNGNAPIICGISLVRQ